MYAPRAARTRLWGRVVAIAIVSPTAAGRVSPIQPLTVPRYQERRREFSKRAREEPSYSHKRLVPQSTRARAPHTPTGANQQLLLHKRTQLARVANHTSLESLHSFGAVNPLGTTMAKRSVDSQRGAVEEFDEFSNGEVRCNMSCIER
jgi:hypothetical protein